MRAMAIHVECFCSMTASFKMCCPLCTGSPFHLPGKGLRFDYGRDTNLPYSEDDGVAPAEGGKMTDGHSPDVFCRQAGGNRHENKSVARCQPACRPAHHPVRFAEP